MFPHPMTQPPPSLFTIETSENIPNALHEQLRQHFDRLAPHWDRWKRRNGYYYQDLEKLVRFFIPPQSVVLEVGCGTGDLLAAIDPKQGMGIDFSPAMVQIAQGKYPSQQFPHLQFHCAIAEHLTPDLLPDLGNLGAIDYILLSESLSSFVDIQRVLQQLSPWCDRHTRIILTFHNFLWEPILRLGEHLGLRCPQPQQSWLSMTDVINLLQIAGYTSTQKGRRCLVPKGIPLLADWINRFIAPLPGLNHLCLTHYLVARKQVHVSNPTAYTCSVIVPARNEAGNINATLDRLPPLGSHTEVIFVEGHSQDDTWNVIQTVMNRSRPGFSLKAFQQSGQGKADAVHLGFAEATGDILIILDADLTVQPEDLDHFFEVISQGWGEFINGSRLVYPRSIAAMPGVNMLANKFFSLLFSFLLGQPIKDTLCGTKVLWREDFERMNADRDYFGNFDPFGDFELLFGAARFGLHIVDVPVRYQPRQYGSSNIAHVKEGLTLLKMCGFAAQKIKFI
ncbi:MAG: glycosyltransferase [Prochlorotrichaceae cyanobacterium]